MTTSNDREAHIVVDLGFGDAGKGTMTDYLARERKAHTVIRFNGGAQARHNVVTPDGRHHAFSQFGSATFVPGVRTHLSRHMVLNPLAMLVEERYLRDRGVDDAFARTTVSEEALVITPFQRAANRLRELARSDGRHGSCGMGIGETVSDSLTLGRSVLRAGDLLDERALMRKILWLQAHKRAQMREVLESCRGIPAAKEEIAWLEEPPTKKFLDGLAEFAFRSRIVEDGHLGLILDEPGAVVFEGSQGVLLDEWRGFHPYTTWSTCTFENALGLLAEHGYEGRVERLGVVRAYMTRHGPGPFVSEDDELTARIPDTHNVMDDWQRGFRVGWFDAVAVRYAIAACGGVDALAVTCFDRLRGIADWRGAARSYLIPPGLQRPGDDELFVLADGRKDLVRDIKLGPARDLSHQQALTAALERCVAYQGSATSSLAFEEQVDDHLSSIERETGAKVRVASFGTAATDKRSFF